jgi:hypothetical protein
MICSDGWPAYSELHKHGFLHGVVNHTNNFLNPKEQLIHTQNIENLWRGLRRFLSNCSSYSRQNLRSYINEFIFRKSNVDTFESILSAFEAKYSLTK